MRVRTSQRIAPALLCLLFLCAAFCHGTRVDRKTGRAELDEEELSLAYERPASTGNEVRSRSLAEVFALQDPLTELLDAEEAQQHAFMLSHAGTDFHSSLQTEEDPALVLADLDIEQRQQSQLHGTANQSSSAAAAATANKDHSRLAACSQEHFKCMHSKQVPVSPGIRKESLQELVDKIRRLNRCEQGRYMLMHDTHALSSGITEAVLGTACVAVPVLCQCAAGQIKAQSLLMQRFTCRMLDKDELWVLAGEEHEQVVPSFQASLAYTEQSSKAWPAKAQTSRACRYAV
jgi:hypothetical protein